MKKWYGLGALVLVIVLLSVFHGRFNADFWPLDASRVGPNLVASVVQWIIIALVAYLVAEVQTLRKRLAKIEKQR